MLVLVSNLHDNTIRAVVLYIRRLYESFVTRRVVQTKGVIFMIKKRISLIGLALLSSITLAACSNGGQTSSVSSSSHVKTEQKRSSDKKASTSTTSTDSQTDADSSTSTESSSDSVSTSASSDSDSTATSQADSQATSASSSQTSGTSASASSTAANTTTAQSVASNASSTSTASDPWHGYSEAYVRQALISVGANAKAVNQIPTSTLQQAFSAMITKPYGTDPGYLWRQLYSQYPNLGNPAGNN